MVLGVVLISTEGGGVNWVGGALGLEGDVGGVDGVGGLTGGCGGRGPLASFEMITNTMPSRPKPKRIQGSNDTGTPRSSNDFKTVSKAVLSSRGAGVAAADGEGDALVLATAVADGLGLPLAVAKGLEPAPRSAPF